MDPNSENRLIRALEEVAYELRSKKEQAGEHPWDHVHPPSVPTADVREVAKLLQADVDYLNSQRLGTRDNAVQYKLDGYRRALYLIKAWTGVEP